MSEATAEHNYQWLLDNVAIPAVTNFETFGTDLERAGRKMFGKKFHGVYMRNNIPRSLSAARPYAIINLDAEADPGNGSHWIAVAFHKGGVLVYDSFGTLHQVPVEFSERYPRVELTDGDAEQKRDETNCGARALAWLLLVELFGIEQARKI